MGTNEPLTDESKQLRRDKGLPLVREERYDGRNREVAADDRRVLDHLPLFRAQTVEPLGEQGVDRRRDREVAAVLGGHRAHLLHEERVALRCGHDSLSDRRGQRGLGGQAHQQ